MRRLLPLSALLACASARVIPPPPRMRIDVAEPVLVSPVDAAPVEGVLSWAPLADGARVSVGARGAAIVSPDGAIVEARALSAPSRCVPRAWGARAIVFCPDEGEPPTRLASALPRLIVLRAEAGPWVASRDGRSLTREGPCDDAPGDGPLTACSFEDGAWREWRSDAPGALLDRYGTLALTTRCLPSVPCEVGVYDIELARWRPTLLPDATARWIRAGFDRDGQIVGVVHTGHRGSVGWFVRGPPGVPLRVLRLPAAATDAATDGRDVALFSRGSEAWFSDDGGISLRPVRGCAAGLLQNASATSIRMGEDARCEGGVCAIAARCALRARPVGAGIP